MNYLRQIFIFIFMGAASLASAQLKSVGNKELIKLDSVDHIQIRDLNKADDFTEILLVRFTPEETKAFVDKWNKASSGGARKFITRYWIDVFFKDGKKRTFRLSGRYIKERTDWCFELGDPSFHEAIWNARK
jgi:hypothetical protein